MQALGLPAQPIIKYDRKQRPEPWEELWLCRLSASSGDLRSLSMKPLMSRLYRDRMYGSVGTLSPVSLWDTCIFPRYSGHIPDRLYACNWTVGNICVHIICSAYEAPRGLNLCTCDNPLRHAGSFAIYLYVKDTYQAYRTKSSKIRMNLLGPRIREYLSEHGWKVSIYVSYFMHENHSIIGLRQKKNTDKQGQCLFRFMYVIVSWRTSIRLYYSWSLIRAEVPPPPNKTCNVTQFGELELEKACSLPLSFMEPHWNYFRIWTRLDLFGKWKVLVQCMQWSLSYLPPA